MAAAVATEMVSTGIRGLDAVLKGGLPLGHVFLVEGALGTGKTTLGLQFLLAGKEEADRGLLYITLSQTAGELMQIARSHGFDLEKIKIVELLAAETQDRGATQTVLQTAEEELDGLIGQIEALVESHRPSRLVVDSLSELRLISTSALRFRRAVTWLNAKMASKRITTLFLESSEAKDETGFLKLITHGALRLDWKVPDYGVMQRRIQVIKMRGAAFVEGYHDLGIETGGIVVYPRLIPEPIPVERPAWELRSNDLMLDEMLGGGLPGNSTTLISGDTGCGKSVLCSLFAHATAESGEKAAMFLFEELEEDVLARAEALGMRKAGSGVDARVHFEHLNPLETSQGQLFSKIQRQVEDGARLIVIDSITGFVRIVRAGGELLPQFNALMTTLKRMNVATLMTLNQAADRPGEKTQIDFSFLCDNVIRLAHYRSDGEIGRSMWIGKKRYGPHSRRVADYGIEPGGVRISAIKGDFAITRETTEEGRG